MKEDFFKNRREAGERLAELLLYYEDDAVLFALPRGGVVVGSVVAEKLKIPLRVIVAKKIGHPFSSEFAIGAITASGVVVADKSELSGVDQEWLKVEMTRKQEEAKKALKFYMGGSTYNQIALYDKIALIIDDGVATGSTMLAAIEEIKLLQPKKLVAGVPVISKEILMALKERVDKVVAVIVPEYFLGAVGAYYDDFEQVDDIEVLKLLKQSRIYERTED